MRNAPERVIRAGPGQARGLSCGCRYINSSWALGGQCPHAFKPVWPAGRQPSVHWEEASEFLLNHSTA